MKLIKLNFVVILICVNLENGSCFSKIMFGKRYGLNNENETFYTKDSFETLKNNMVSLVNCYRACHSSPSLTRNISIETSQSNGWAQKLADSNRLQHSDSNYGENLYAGPVGSSGARPINSWYSECEGRYNYGSGSNSGRCGHFTQLVWKSSNYIGIGIAQSSKYGYIVVANFDPAGNYRGQYVENVLRPDLNCVQSCKKGAGNGNATGSGSDGSGNGVGSGSGSNGNNGNGSGVHNGCNEYGPGSNGHYEDVSGSYGHHHHGSGSNGHQGHGHGSDSSGHYGHGSDSNGHYGHGSDSNGHYGHGSDSNGHHGHGSDSNGHYGHGSDSNGHYGHGSDSNGHYGHGSDSNGHYGHGSDSNGHYGHGSDSNGQNGHGSGSYNCNGSWSGLQKNILK